MKAKQDLVEVLVRHVPRQVRLNFRLACLREGKTMAEELIKLMEEYTVGQIG